MDLPTTKLCRDSAPWCMFITALFPLSTDEAHLHYVGESQISTRRILLSSHVHSAMSRAIKAGVGDTFSPVASESEKRGRQLNNSVGKGAEQMQQRQTE